VLGRHGDPVGVEPAGRGDLGVDCLVERDDAATVQCGRIDESPQQVETQPTVGMPQPAGHEQVPAAGADR
jgi:hypothetical protein